MDMSQNPFLCQLISSSQMTPAEIKEVLEIFSSVNGQVQLATVIKSGIRSVLITVKNSLVNVPALKIINFVKPENIKPALTTSEHRAIVLYAKNNKVGKFFSGPLFDQPLFLIGKNMLFDMIVSDMTSLLQTYNGPAPVETAIKKLDEYFDTIPDSPMSDRSFKDVESPEDLIPTRRSSKRSFESTQSLSPKRMTPISFESTHSLSSKRMKLDSPISFISETSVVDEEEPRAFQDELSDIFPDY